MTNKSAHGSPDGDVLSKLTLSAMRQMLLPRDAAGLEDHQRGSERNRRAVLAGSIATVARVVQLGASLVTVPLTLKYLGNERFGLWMTISSVLAMAAFADRKSVV